MGKIRQDVSDRFWSKVHKSEGCWEWQAQLNNMGYGCFRLNDPRRMTYAHRYSWEIYYGTIPSGINVLHRCDNPKCVKPTHLFLGTLMDNSKDAAAKGRVNTTKLTPDQVATLKEYIQGHQSYGMTKYFAEKFGVHRSSIRRAVKGISFKLLSH